jgi:hypothetical protein
MAAPLVDSTSGVVCYPIRQPFSHAAAGVGQYDGVVVKGGLTC